MSKRTTIRIPDDVYDQLNERAKREQRTVSNLVILLLRKALAPRGSTAPADAGSDRGTVAHE